MTSERCGPRGTWQATALPLRDVVGFFVSAVACFCPLPPVADAELVSLDEGLVVLMADFVSAVVEVPPCFASVGRARRPSPHESLLLLASACAAAGWSFWKTKAASFWSPSAGKRT